jgi:acyl dehydratase
MSETAPTTTAIDISDLKAHEGQPLGVSSWRKVTQEEVSAFAVATGDEQWIHVDPERAKSGPFGTTVAHGFMTLGMFTGMLYELLEVTGAALILNYGVNKVRFPAPVPTGSNVRGNIAFGTVEEVPGGIQVEFRVTVEIEGKPKPACAAEILFRYYREVPAAPAATTAGGGS